MDKNLEILKVIAKHARIEKNGEKINVVFDKSFDSNITDDLIKLWDLHIVSNRRELLTAFRTWWWGNREKATDITNNDIDRYLGG